MAKWIWTMRAYNLDGGGLTALSYDPDLPATNEIRHADDRRFTMHLNGVDELGFTLYLDDPMALNIRRLKTVVKLWREVQDDDGNILFSNGASSPAFAGVVGWTHKDGNSNQMQIKCYSPLWRLQSRFHILNHYLNINPNTGSPYKQSELMWRLIQMVNGAFGVDSRTGIVQGTFAWPGEPTVAPYFVAKGSNTWSNIFDDLMVRPSSPDIYPDYVHDGTYRLMEFSTDQRRGADVSASVKFNYHTDPEGATPANLENMSEEEMPSPGDFANYVWAVGQGGPNSGKIAKRENTSAAANSDGYGEIGIYMARVDRNEIKRLAALGPIADAELAQRKVPKSAYTVTLSPAAELYYGSDFVMGDVVALNADKGALQVTNKKQRIYQVELVMSANNMETPNVLVANDFYGKVAA